MGRKAKCDFTFPTNYKKLDFQPVSDSGNVPESEILETVEAEMVS